MFSDLITAQDIDDILADRGDAVEARHDAALDASWAASQAAARAARDMAQAVGSPLCEPSRDDDAEFDAMWANPSDASLFRPDLLMTAAEVSSISNGGSWHADSIFRELWGFHLIDLCGDRDELTMSRVEFEALGDAATLATLVEWIPQAAQAH